MSSLQEEKLGTGVTAEKLNTSSDQSQYQEPQPRRRGGCAGFIKRWWWLLLLIGAIVFLVVFLPIIFVALPKIVRHNINEAKLTIQGIAVTNTQSGDYLMAINSTVTTSSSQKATIKSFNASLYLEDKLPHTPFAFVEMPELTSKKTIPVNISQPTTIFDETAFADFVSWYLLNDTFLVTVDGWTHVQVGKLPKVKVHFQKTVNLTGLNKFEGISLLSSQILLPPNAEGDNFVGFVNIPNPSVLTVEIGNASFTSSLNSTALGPVFIDNLTLFPGNNNFSTRGTINQTETIGFVLSEPYCNTGILPLSVLGQNITNKGQELAYFEQAFRSNTIILPTNVGADLLPFNINVSCSAIA